MSVFPFKFEGENCELKIKSVQKIDLFDKIRRRQSYELGNFLFGNISIDPLVFYPPWKYVPPPIIFQTNLCQGFTFFSILSLFLSKLTCGYPFISQAIKIMG